jgi:hypothetical protein
MNIACDNKIEYISLRYISYPYMPSLLKNKKFTSHYSSEELKESVEKPKILHYAAGKPWKYEANKADIWWEYFYKLGLPRTKIFAPLKKYDALSMRNKITYLLYVYLRKKLSKKGVV